MAIDIERARRETPGCATVLHFNNAGSALMPVGVLDAQIEHLQLEAQIGGYESADVARDKVERVYDAAASLIGASRNEIAVIENATRAWDMAFYSIPFKPGDRILTAMAEYASNYIAYLQVAKKYGAQVEVIPNDEHGQVSIEHLQSMIDDRVRLIAITHVPTNGGLVNPVAEIGEVARQAGILYLIDACQSVGQLPVDVERIGCDMLSATGRKYLRGPRGTGFLYVRQSVLDQLEPVMLDLHAAQWTSRDTYTVRDDARRFENWETNYAAKIGLGVAIDYALEWGMDPIWERVQLLASQLRQNLNAIADVTVCDIGEVQGGIVTFTIEGRDLNAVKEALAAQAINVTVSRTSSTRLDMEDRGLSHIVRASVHYYNSEDEVARFCAAIEAQA
ncbi:MAG: aminotransferase class V-fold PLP-dependent enzyme [Chloroflexota bacterium]|nr:aminotransferase class V-fold PLP-dependent enzyme [Chloroflexota bacterium]